MSSLTRQAARGTALMSGAHLLLTASSYVVAVLLARSLGPADYGVYGIVYSVLLTVEVATRLGVPEAVVRLIAEEDATRARLEATGITLTLILYSPVFVVFWVGAPVLAAIFHVENGSFLFRVAALDIPVFGLYFMAEHILNGQRRFAAQSLGISLYALSKLLGIVALSAFGISIAGALVVNAVASLVAVAFALQRIGPRVLPPTLADRGPIMRLAVPVAVSMSGLQLLLSVDLWALNAAGAGIPDATKGLYVAALNLARVPNLLAYAAFAVLVPSIARAIAAGDHQAARHTARTAMRFLLVMLVPGSVLVAVNAEDLMALLFSSSYVPGAPFLAILIFAHGFGYTLFNTLCGILIATGQQHRSATIALAVLPVAVILNVVLIGAWGAMGAAVSALIGTWLAALLAGACAWRSFGPLLSASVLVRTLLAGVAVGVAGRVVEAHGLLLLVELVAIGLAYLMLIVGLGLLRREDLRSFWPARARDS